MGYTLNGTTIRRPNEMSEQRNDQYAENKTLDGSVVRDYFGSRKRIWTLNYKDCPVTDFNTINALYVAYTASASPIAFACTDSNYTVSGNVHVSLEERGFSVKGDSYLCEFVLTLVEA